MNQLRLSQILSKPFMALIWLYQRLISPFLPSSCAYHPTCSNYSMEAFAKHGVFWGFLLSIKRVSSCHPFHLGGVDPVPDKVKFSSLLKRNG